MYSLVPQREHGKGDRLRSRSEPKTWTRSDAQKCTVRRHNPQRNEINMPSAAASHMRRFLKGLADGTVDGISNHCGCQMRTQGEHLRKGMISPLAVRAAIRVRPRRRPGRWLSALDPEVDRDQGQRGERDRDGKVGQLFRLRHGVTFHIHPKDGGRSRLRSWPERRCA